MNSHNSTSNSNVGAQSFTNATELPAKASKALSSQTAMIVLNTSTREHTREYL
jgi:hypothetical protein